MTTYSGINGDDQIFGLSCNDTLNGIPLRTTHSS
jgi:hypothetical protein